MFKMSPSSAFTINFGKYFKISLFKNILRTVSFEICQRKKKERRKEKKVKMLTYIQIFIAVCFYFSDILPNSLKLEYQKKTAHNRNYKSCTKNVEKYFPLSVKRNAFACESVWDFQQIIF